MICGIDASFNKNEKTVITIIDDKTDNRYTLKKLIVLTHDEWICLSKSVKRLK